PVAGQHGVERRDAAGRISRHAFPSQELDWVRRRLADAAARHPGLLVEDKGLSLALHCRRAPRLAGYGHRLVRSLGARLGERYHVQTGKRVVELKPAGKDKGVAVLEFMQEEPFRGRTPLFVGDDVTDEYGFATVNRLHGHSVKVGPGRTVARLRERTRDEDFGFLAVELLDCARQEQEYLVNTPILVTRLYDRAGGGVEITDFAPRFRHHGRMFCPMMLVRHVRRMAGNPRIRVRVRPARDYGRRRADITCGSNHIRYVGSELALRLTTDVPITAVVEENPFFLEH